MQKEEACEKKHTRPCRWCRGCRIYFHKITRESKLARALYANYYSLGAGKFRVETSGSTGKDLLKNDIPIIVLTDDLCASSRESEITMARSYEKVIVVGSNSAGYQLSGSAMSITLPNTGIRAFIAPYFWQMYDGENVE